jgi:arylsulfatase A-like enzyme
MNSNLPRRDFIKVLGVAALAGPTLLRESASAAEVLPPKPSKLNVVLMVADDQRHDTIAALGNPHIKTPNLDALVSDGMTFTSARCMGSLHGAVCIPSRACLHTGRMLFNVPDNMGKFDTLGQTLQKAGYTCGGFGKWHNEGPSFARSFNAGGSIFFNGMDQDQFNVPVSAFSPTGAYPGKTSITPNKFSSELFADSAIDFIQKRKSADKPFFCYLAFTSPHDPRTPPPEFKAMYKPETMPLPGNFMPEHPFKNGELRNRDENLAPFPRTPENTKSQLCDYYGMISAQDAQVGRVMAALKESGQAENTIVIYTGDHGLAIGSHGLFGKQNVYDHSSRIPMIINGPMVPKQKTSDAIVYGFDLFPTICELLGVTGPESIQGKSLAGIIAGQDQKVRSSAFHAYIHIGKPVAYQTQQAVFDGRWKMIRYHVDGKERIQLFDIPADPDEMHDLSAHANASQELPRLRALLGTWQRDLHEPAAYV